MKHRFWRQGACRGEANGFGAQGIKPNLLDKEHGRLEDRRLWCTPTAPQILGLAGAAQVIRIERLVDELPAGG